MSAKAKIMPADVTRPVNVSTNLSTNLAVLHMAGTPFTVLSYLSPDINVQRGPHALRGTASPPQSLGLTQRAIVHGHSLVLDVDCNVKAGRGCRTGAQSALIVRAVTSPSTPPATAKRSLGRSRKPTTRRGT